MTQQFLSYKVSKLDDAHSLYVTPIDVPDEGITLLTAAGKIVAAIVRPTTARELGVQALQLYPFNARIFATQWILTPLTAPSAV